MVPDSLLSVFDEYELEVSTIMSMQTFSFTTLILCLLLFKVSFSYLHYSVIQCGFEAISG